MARFDFNPLPTINPDASPTPGMRQNATADAFGADQGRALQGLGQTLEQAGDVANRHALAFQELNNETYAKQADTDLQKRLRTIGFGGGTKPDGTPDDTPGYFASAGQGAYDGAKPTGEAADKAYQDVLQSLPNDAARRMFMSSGQARINSFQESIASHAAQGRKEWILGASVARQHAAVESAAAYFDDPLKVDQNIAIAKGEVLAQGELQGQSAEQVVEGQRQAESNVRIAVIDRMMTDDPLKADSYYKQHMDSISGGQRAQVEKALRGATIPVISNNFVNRLMSGGDIPNPAAADAVTKGLPFDAIAMAESGGKEFNQDGTRVTSPKGARGSMQVMPGTATSPGFGVQPSNGTPEDDARMGRDYYGAMVGRYGGNQSLALAAYNAGPGKVDAALARIGAKPGDQVDASRVVSMMPAETRAYVEKINGAAPAVPGHIPTSQDVKANAADWTTRAMTFAQQAYPNNPQAQKMIVSDLESRMGQIQRGQNEADKAARGTLLAKVNGFTQSTDGSFVQLPMSKRPQTLDQLLADPASKAAWNDMDDITRASVLNRLGKDDNPRSVQSDALYHQIDGVSHSDPDAFMHMNFTDPKYVDVLPRAQLSALMGEQQKVIQAQGKDAASASNWSRAMTIAKTAPGYHEAGIPDSITKASTQSQRDTYNQFGSRLVAQVQQYQQVHKKLPTPDEVRGMAGNLLVEATVPRSGWLSYVPGFGTTTKPVALVPVPDDKRAAITREFQGAYKRAPTAAEVDAIWTSNQMRLHKHTP